MGRKWHLGVCAWMGGLLVVAGAILKAIHPLQCILNQLRSCRWIQVSQRATNTTHCVPLALPLPFLQGILNQLRSYLWVPVAKVVIAQH